MHQRCATLACHLTMYTSHCAVCLQSGSFEFSNARAAMVSPLAKKLFMIDGVTGM
jgi:hypothetical protein